MTPPVQDKTIKSLGPMVFELSGKLDSLISIQNEMKTEISRIEEKSDGQYRNITKQIEKLREDTFTRTGDQRVAVERAVANSTQGDMALGSRVARLEETSTAAWQKIDNIVEKLGTILSIVGDKEEWKRVKDHSSRGNTAYTILATIGTAALLSLIGLVVYFFASGALVKRPAPSQAGETAPAVYRMVK
jgi:hypothetical protein